MKERMREAIIEIMDAAKDLAIATVRADGYPQNTTVSFVNDGLTIYFACGAQSQKAHNLRRDERVSITLTAPYTNWLEIKGLSMSARARELHDDQEIERVGELFMARFPEAREFESAMPSEFCMFEIVPEVISVLDYSQGFGHTELVLATAGDVAATGDAHRHIWLPPES